MGALHAGHLGLGALARRTCQKVVFSIFVNPAQFAPHEDFDRYPRTEAADLAALAQAEAADVVFAPAAAEMYPPGFSTSVSVAGPATGLESDARPHFFGGVATVVTKLLLQALPDTAVFGEKDYQQLMVIRKVVEDLAIPVEIIGAPTARDHDGLALSSRNAYLTAPQRQIAVALNRVLRSVIADVLNGVALPEAIARGRADLIAAGFDAVDYLQIRNSATLEQPLSPGQPLRVLAAARLGAVRLIDNMAVAPASLQEP